MRSPDDFDDDDLLGDFAFPARASAESSRPDLFDSLMAAETARQRAAREYRERNRERLREQARAWRQRNAARRREADRARRAVRKAAAQDAMDARLRELHRQHGASLMGALRNAPEVERAHRLGLLRS